MPTLRGGFIAPQRSNRRQPNPRFRSHARPPGLTRATAGCQVRLGSGKTRAGHPAARCTGHSGQRRSRRSSAAGDPLGRGRPLPPATRQQTCSQTPCEGRSSRRLPPSRHGFRHSVSGTRARPPERSNPIRALLPAQVKSSDSALHADPTSTARGDERDDDKSCEGDQDVQKAAHDPAASPLDGCRLWGRNRVSLRDPQGIAVAPTVQLEQVIGLVRAAATHVREHEVAVKPAIPDEPASLAFRTRSTAKIACSHSDSVARVGATWPPSSSSSDSVLAASHLAE